MIPPNPDTATVTDLHGFPTRAAVRAAAFHAYQEAIRLRYPHDEALDRAAEAVADLFPSPPDGGDTYDDLADKLQDAKDELRSADDELLTAEATIRELRQELDEANDQITHYKDAYL